MQRGALEPAVVAAMALMMAVARTAQLGTEGLEAAQAVPEGPGATVAAHLRVGMEVLR